MQLITSPDNQFHDGNPATGVLGTYLAAAWHNAVQGEIAAPILAAGMTLDPNNNAQLLAAILALIEARSGNYLLDTGAANASVVAMNPAIGAYTNGLQVKFRIARNITGGSTLNAGPGAVPLLRDDGTPTQNGDAPGGSIVSATFDAAVNGFLINSIVPSQIAAQVAAILAAGVQSQGKLNGVNNPNLLFNSSGEFGSIGWNLGSFSQFNDTSGEIGSFFSNSGALNAYTFAVAGQQVPIGPSQNVCLSMDVSNGASGSVQISLAAYTSAGSYISNIGTLAIPNSSLTRYSTTAFTPPNTAYVVPQLVLNGVASTAFGVVFRRVKVEQGTTPSLYSQEASVASGTAPQFDSSLRPASTAFVAGSLGSFSGAISFSVNNTALTPANVGQTIVAGSVASPMTWTPPALASVPIGAAITLANISSYPLTLAQQAGTDRFIATNSPLGTATSYVVPYGSTVTLVKYQANTWLCIGTGADLTGPMFSMLGSGGTGYQKLPSGIIIQWGSSLTTGGQLTQTLPIAFPVSQLAATSCVYGGAASIVTSISSLTQTQVVVNAYASATGAASGSVNVSWIAIGR